MRERPRLAVNDKIGIEPPDGWPSLVSDLPTGQSRTIRVIKIAALAGSDTPSARTTVPPDEGFCRRERQGCYVTKDLESRKV
jgi:hypothetical protein